MKYRQLKFLSAFMLFLSLGCKKKNDEPDLNIYPEFIVFGHFITPNCFGNDVCVEIFKLESGSLLEDSNDNVPDGSVAYTGNYNQKLSQSDYDQIETIFRNNLPDELLTQNSGGIGGFQEWNTNYFYFEYKTATEYKYWILDGSFDGSLGTTLQAFITQLNLAVSIASN